MSFLDNLFTQSSSAGGGFSDTVAGDISESRGFLATIASAISGSRMAVDLTAAVTGYLQTLASTVTAARIAVNLDATPAANIATLAGAVATGNMKVLLQAGSNAIGKLAANVGINIGTVDINNALQLPPALGQRTKVTSLGVTIATDQPPVLVADGGTPLMVIGAGGNPLPVTGLVTVANSLVANLGTSLPPGGNNIGKVDVASLPYSSTNLIGVVRELSSGNVSVATIPASATEVVLAAVHDDRVGLIIVNNKTSTSILYFKFGAGASPTSWTDYVEPGARYEMPLRYYTGEVRGVWSNAVGDAHVTDIGPIAPG